MLEHDTVDADGVLTRVPISFAYAERWAKILDYTLVYMSPRESVYASPHAKGKSYYYPRIEAHPTHLKLSTATSRFTLYFHDEPIKHGVTCSVGMWGEPLPETTFQALLLSVRDLPYSAQAIAKLIEKSDWLDLNPIYRGLPGVAGQKSTPAQSADESPATRPLDW